MSEFKYGYALENAVILKKRIEKYCERVEIAGSIRRKKPNPRDIDLVVIPKDIEEIKKRLPQPFKRCGNKIISGFIDDMPFDIYFTTNENFEVILLWRTGSAKHNIKLSTKALENGWKLKMSSGLYNEKGELIDNTERGIIEKILGVYVEPEMRNE